jgi:hypothetical protein
MWRTAITVAQTSSIVDVNRALKDVEGKVEFGNLNSNAVFRILIVVGADWLNPDYRNWND